MKSKRRWWHIKSKRTGSAGAAFSIMDEIFHPQSTNAREIIQEQSRQAIDQTGSADPDKKKITIRIKKK